MASQIEDWLNRSGLRGISTVQLAVAVVVALIAVRTWLRHDKDYAKIPGSGYPPIPSLSSWVAAVRFMRDPVKVMTDGIERFQRRPFRIATLQGEYVVITSREQIAEYIRAPDDVLNMLEAADDQQQIQWTMGYGVTFRNYHNPIVRGRMTKSLDTQIPAMLQEMETCFTQHIGSPSNYEPFQLYTIIAMTVAKTSNRVFVGEPFCNDEGFLKNAVNYAEGVVISAEMLRPFPDWSKKFLVKWAPIAKYRAKAIEYLGPTIKERLDKLNENGKTEDDNLMDWLIDGAPPVEKNVEMLVERVMALEVASIHTTTMNFTYALYRLAAEPDKYLPELREEARKFLQGSSTTRESISNMVKIDSFLREASRLGNDGLLATQRNAKQRFVFADGTVLPAGAKVGHPLLHMHRDPAVYDQPDEFDGFRFSRLKEGEASPTGKASFVSTDVCFQAFGHGRHACPGRFFAVAEMKLMLAMLVLRYDITLEPGTAPKPMRVGTMSLPDTKLKVLVRGIRE